MHIETWAVFELTALVGSGSLRLRPSHTKRENRLWVAGEFESKFPLSSAEKSLRKLGQELASICLWHLTSKRNMIEA